MLQSKMIYYDRNVYDWANGVTHSKHAAVRRERAIARRKKAKARK